VALQIYGTKKPPLCSRKERSEQSLNHVGCLSHPLCLADSSRLSDFQRRWVQWFATSTRRRIIQ